MFFVFFLSKFCFLFLSRGVWVLGCVFLGGGWLRCSRGKWREEGRGWGARGKGGGAASGWVRGRGRIEGGGGK